MLRQLRDAMREQRDLNIGTAGILFMQPKPSQIEIVTRSHTLERRVS